MKAKKINILFRLNLLLIGLILSLTVFYPLYRTATLPNNLILSNDDLEDIAISNVSCSVSDEGLVFKLFNLFPIRTLNAKIEKERKAYIGGFPIGLNIKTDGVLVVDKSFVETSVGKVFPQTEILVGDIIKKINGTDILFAENINEAMEKIQKDEETIQIEVLRNNESKDILSTPVKEYLTGSYRLGLAVRESIAGVGTVSYVKFDGSFGSLGHPICDGDTGTLLPCYDGNVYGCKILGYNKGVRGKPGELRGAFTSNQSIGKIMKNNKFGVYGCYDNFQGDIKNIYEISARFGVTIGKAQILTTLDDKPELFDIEIIRSMNQQTPNDKSMVLRVTDKKLLSTTGGIVQGMSGSPIIQNGKIVGAVTHVFVNDPTKGYGVYLDWMYEN